MTNINILQNVVVDKSKIAALIKETKSDDLKELLNIKDSQLANLRKGNRRPSANGLLRLMIMYDIAPGDIATVESAV